MSNINIEQAGGVLVKRIVFKVIVPNNMAKNRTGGSYDQAMGNKKRNSSYYFRNAFLHGNAACSANSSNGT